MDGPVGFGSNGELARRGGLNLGTWSRPRSRVTIVATVLATTVGIKRYCDRSDEVANVGAGIDSQQVLIEKYLEYWYCWTVGERRTLD